MRLQSRGLWSVLLVALAVTFVEMTWLPWLRLRAFTPFLIIAYYSCPFLTCLWLSLFCGLLTDLLASNLHLGVHALSYYMVTLILYKQRRFFFEDNLSTLPVMTALFSGLSTVVLALVLYFLEGGAPMNWVWVLTDFAGYSLADAIYASLCFQTPILLMKMWPKRKAALPVKRPQ